MKIKRFMQWLTLFLFIISFSVFVAINFRPLYVFDIGYLNILDYTDVSRDVLLHNFDQLMAFLNNPFNTTLALPDFPMSASGAQHFYDVKKLFLLDYAVLIITAIPAIWFIVSLVKQKALWKLIRPFQVALVVPVIFGFLMAVGFDTFFVRFHELFFANDDWLFNPVTDPIINVLPEAFFMHCFILFFVLIEFIFLSGVIAGRLQLRRSYSR
ncbi:TIGR01906 family membrane protein [Enterococcus sp. HY326]|uniref:TIGR01906 family membrane protein n=1 Tax=Enterococcus sp. HY326 TaxID=2971265 RepID=UPI00223F2069|nr:TIGR01906 family membrane protein [Enterococcus sp. HY326]